MKYTYQTTIVWVLGLLIFTLLPAIGQTPESASFIGDWGNKDFKTRAVTRVQIRYDGAQIVAHVWGRCHPQECDWGKATATAKGQTLSVTWNQGFATETLELTILADESLQMVAHRHFTDNSGRPDYETKDIFTKGLVHDWSDPVSK